MDLDDLDLGERHAATVTAITPLTPPGSAGEVRELILEVDADTFRFDLGQCIAVAVPGPHAFGESHHVRLYTVAGAPGANAGRPEVVICVRRCNYVDAYSGERFEGVASNYLCDRAVGDRITIMGPTGAPFEVPRNRDAGLLMIGLGTGIAPFRGLVRHIYHDTGGWRGKVRLFHGARTGLELIYMNDHKNDFADYVDEETFRAFRALSPRPHWDEPAAFDEILRVHQAEVWGMLGETNTRVYVAGLESIRATLDGVFSEMAGSHAEWQRRKAELEAGGRWTELLY